jgi:predicted amidophosphoribosyltransferase
MRHEWNREDYDGPVEELDFGHDRPTRERGTLCPECGSRMEPQRPGHFQCSQCGRRVTRRGRC